MGVYLSDRDQKMLVEAMDTLSSPLEHGGMESWLRAASKACLGLLGGDSGSSLLVSPGSLEILYNDFPAVSVDAMSKLMWADQESHLRSVEGDMERVGKALDARPAVFSDFQMERWSGVDKRRTELYQLGCQPAGLLTFTFMGAPSDQRYAMLAFAREKDQPDHFSDDEGLALLSLLSPSMKAGLRLLSAAEGRRSALAAVLERLSYPTIVFDLGATELYRNPPMESLLGAQPELWGALRRRAGLMAVRRRAQRRTDDPLLEGGAMGTAVDATILPPGSFASSETVLLSLPLDKSRDAARRLKERFGLTPREADIAAELLARKSNKEIAARLGISPVTVRHHVVRIFDKVGIRDRRSLSKVLAQLEYSPDAGKVAL